MQNKILMGHLFALVTILLWGTTFISTKVLLRSFTPIEILFFRLIRHRQRSIPVFYQSPSTDTDRSETKLSAP